jgi:NTP pyrophosphatase (non-canonical NTP hydrolase)
MQKDTSLPTDISLKKLQEYVRQMNTERGFNTKDASKKLVMLMEEVGELAKAVRQSVGLKFSDTTKHTELAEELADVQIVLLGLASLTGIDMYEAIVKKEEKNQKRIWK